MSLAGVLGLRKKQEN
ncbi:hypothetical protein [Secundilactobacillus silagei]